MIVEAGRFCREQRSPQDELCEHFAAGFRSDLLNDGPTDRGKL